MAVSQRLRRLLTGEYASHRHLAPPGAHAREVAESAGVPGAAFAKVVVLQDAAGDYLMAVVPSTRRLDLAAVSEATRRVGLRLASERELIKLFPDCEPGAMPPFGELYGIAAYVDPCFREWPEFVFRGGSHDELVTMRFADYEFLARAVVGPSCLHRKTAPARRVAGQAA
jgi:Ala-tRNA(Pro) deacylase